MRFALLPLLFLAATATSPAADPPSKAKLAVSVGGALDATVGQKLTLKVTAEPETATVTIDDAPRGMELAAGALIWTPTEAQAGTHSVVLKVAAGDAEKVSEWTVVVRPPSVRVSGIGRQFAVSEDGKTAVVYSQERTDQFSNDLKRTLTLVDLTTMRVLAETPAAELQQDVGHLRSLAVDAHYVYVADSTADQVVVRSKKDLSEVKRVTVAARGMALQPVADKYLFLSNQQGGRGTVLTTPDLVPADPKAVGCGVHLTAKGQVASNQAPQAVAAGWLYEGLVYDPTFTTVKAVVHPRTVAEFGTNGLRWVGPNYGYNEYGGGFPAQYPGQYGVTSPTAWLAPWGTSAQPGSLTQGKKTSPLAADKPTPNQYGPAFTATAVLPDKPTAASVRYFAGQTDFGRLNRLRVEMWYHDLATLTPIRKVPLLDEPISQQALNNSLGNPQLLTRTGVVYCLFADRLIGVPTPKLPAASAAPVPYLDPTAAVTVLGDKELSVKLPAVTGAKEPAEYEVINPLRGVEVDGDKLTISPDPIREKLTEAVVGVLANHRSPSNGQFAPPVECLAAYLEQATPAFEKLTGKKPTGIPVWLSVEVAARSKNTDRADGQTGVFVDLPAGPVLAKAKARQEELIAQTRPQADPRVPEMIRSVAESSKRVAELEKKVDESNAKLDRLLKALEPKKP